LVSVGTLWVQACQPVQAPAATSQQPDSGADASVGPKNAAGALLTSKTPYQPKQDWQQYSPVPAGFAAVGVQHVARHGSRFLSSRSDDVLMMQLIKLAEQEQGLTPLGQRFAAVMTKLHQVHQPAQYGEISAIGVAEHQGMANRLLARFPALFGAAAQPQLRMAVLHSGRERADQSGDAFVAALVKEQSALASFIDTAKADPATLYFNKAEGSEGYERYREEDPRLKAVMEHFAAKPELVSSAKAMLQRLFSEAFVAKLAAGAIKLTVPDEDDQIASVLDAATVIYSLYSIASNLNVEGPFDFSELLLPEHLLPLAEMDDAESFYGRGPGFAGEDITYRLASRLVADMLKKAEQPDGYVATFRFTHAQAMIPLAAYLGIPGASEPLPVAVNYSYQTSQWRSENVSPMAANVQWEVYQDAKQQLLVRMLHNEQESQFKAQCQPYADTRYFYLLTELQRCLAMP
jgi:hypothetical protein